MATHDPPPKLLSAQIESIRAQTHDNWRCVISDDASGAGPYAELERLAAGDQRFILSRSERPLGFYANFERALGLIPPEAEFVTFADQDDRWHPEKLGRLLGEFDQGVTLVYSDTRIVEPDGRLVSPTYWTERPTNHSDLAGLLISNTITGPASLFRRWLLDLALPFPPRIGQPFHDHWLASLALATGEVRYVKEPLYDYVQHPANVLGHRAANRPGVSAASRWRLRTALLSPRQARRRIGEIRDWWRRMYFDDVRRIVASAEILLERCGDRLDPRKQKQAERVRNMDSGRGLLWLLGRRLRRLGRRSPTLHSERLLTRAVLWRTLASEPRPGAVRDRNQSAPSHPREEK